MGLDICVYKFINKEDTKNYFFTSTIDIKRYGYSLSYPKWAEKFIDYKTIKSPDWVKYKEETGIDFSGYDVMYVDKDEIVLFNPENEEKIFIDSYGIPWHEIQTPTFFVAEVRYQRKGMPSKFWEYAKKHANDAELFIWSFNELLKIKDMFDTNNQEELRLMNNFQRNIIDNFIEGEMIVRFDW